MTALHPEFEPTQLWLFEMAPAVSAEALRLAYELQPPRIEIANNDAVSQRLAEHVGPRPNDRPDRTPMAMPPTLRLRVKEPGFAPDYLNLGHRLLSRRARETLALAPDDVQYLEVDASGSTPDVVAQDYRVLLPLRTADPLDKERSDGGWRDAHQLDGGVEQLWQLRTPHPGAGPLRIAWRNDFTPPSPLFLALGPAWLLASDALALRAQSAELTGLAFIDLQNDGSRTTTVYRTHARGN